MEMVPLDLITGPILCRHCGGNLRWYRGGEAELGRRNNGEAMKIKEIRNYVACLFQNLDLRRFSGDSCMNVSGVASWCNFSSFESEVDFWVYALHSEWNAVKWTCQQTKSVFERYLPQNQWERSPVHHWCITSSTDFVGCPAGNRNRAWWIRIHNLSSYVNL